MSANTILLDFSVDPTQVTGNDSEAIEADVVSALENHFGVGSLEKVVRKEILAEGIQGGTLSIYLGVRGSTINIRTYQNGLVTINIDYYLCEEEKPLLSIENMKELELLFGGKKKVQRVKTFPALRRGAKIDVYMTTTDERLLEYDIDKIIYDERSPFQHIQIVHSLNFGNMLVLDDLQNLAEGDLIYTESIMCRGVENYTDKKILILGGGDGALLYELRKENAKSITMIEIDDMVMQACKVHLRSVCGDTLDNYRTDNYEIIVGDCVDYMLQCEKEKKMFDYVFADLTDIPISPTPQGELWDFIKKILNMSFAITKPDGKYMTHGNGSSSPTALKMFEDVLDQLSIQVKFNKTHAFIPSFMEDWVFYQIQRKNI